MQAIVLILLIAMFSPSLWATSKASSNCELLMQTSYGRLIQLFADKKILTLAELKELSLAREPYNPFSKKTKDIDNLAYSQTLEEALRKKETFENWPATRKAVAVLVKLAAKDESLIDESKVKTRKILNPKLVHKIPFDGRFPMQIVFNRKNAQFVTVNNHPSGANPTTLNLFTDTMIPDTIPTFVEDLIARKNGEVWIAGFEGEEFIVKKLSGNKIHFREEAMRDSGRTSLFETASGNLLLVRSFSPMGVLIRDITDPKDIIDVYSDKIPISKMPVFHITKDGGLLMAIATDAQTTVFSYKNGRMVNIGAMNVSTSNFRNIVLSSDENKHPIVGESLGDRQGYHVVKIVDKKPHPIFRDETLKLNSLTAAFHWDNENQLILAIAGKEDDRHIYFINLSDEHQSRFKIPTQNFLLTKPQWHTLPNGMEVIAISSGSEAAKIIYAKDGATLFSFRSTKGDLVEPAWMTASDGRVYLALDGDDRIDLFSVWQKPAVQGSK